MELNSPVKMVLPQDAKTPLVPDSVMYTESSTVGFAGEKRKAGPDALSAPDARRRAISDANTGLSEYESSSVETEDGEIPELVFHRPKDDEIVKLVYDATALEDFSGLDIALARDHKRGSREYTERFERIKKTQIFCGEKSASKGWGHKYCGKLRMEVQLDKTGHVILAISEVIP